MSFLAPLYALAGLAILAPIIAHLVRRRPKDKIEFSSSLFLEKDQPRLTKSSQIDQWWLLIVRSLLVLLVAAAFARPYWNTPVSTDSARVGVKRMIMVDVSASMKRDGLLDLAKAKSEEWIDAAQPEDIISIYGFHRELIPAFSLETSLDARPEQRRSLAKQAVMGLVTTWFDTNFSDTVRTAVELLSADGDMSDRNESNAPTTLELIIISDFQQGGQYEELATIEWPKGLVVRQVPIGTLGVAESNAFAKLLSSSSATIDDAKSDEASDQVTSSRIMEESTKIRVTNLAQSQMEALKVGWVNREGGLIESSVREVLIPPGQSRIFDVASMPQDARSLRLLGDQVEFDNEFYCTALKKLTYRIVCLTSRTDLDETSAEFFLQQLPLGSESYNFELLVQSIINEDWTLDIKVDPLVFLIGLPDVSVIPKVMTYIEQGGQVLWLLDSPIDDAVLEWRTAISTLSNGEVQDISEGKVSDFRLLQNIDFKDYLFSEFSDAKFSDFTKVRFWRQRDLKLRPSSSIQVLAEFDHGSPAILRQKIGKGELTTFAAGWQPDESQLALSSKFLPLMLRYVQSTIPTSRQLESFVVGSDLEITGPVSITNPDGSKEEIENGDSKTLLLTAPGNYSILSADGSTRYLSVNLSPQESQIARIDATRLLQWGVPLEERRMANPTEGMLRQMRAVELESQQGSWRWLLAIVLVVAAFESTFAWLRSYRQRIPV